MFGFTTRVSLLIAAIIMGIVEGLTEFIPVSSTGHLIVVGKWLGFDEAIGGKARADTFEIFIQLGAILAVVFYFRQRLSDALRKASWGGRVGQGDASARARRFLAGICVATLPAIGVYFVAKRFIDDLPSDVFVATALIVGGAALWAVDQWKPTTRLAEAEDFGWGVIIWIGFAQTLAMVFPGLSRSGATIMAALLVGASNKAAAEFSFFLSIPTMFIACCYKLLKAVQLGQVVAGDWMVFGVGFVVAFLSAVVVVAAFLAFLRKHGFKLFAYYRIAFGLMILGLWKFWH